MHEQASENQYSLKGIPRCEYPSSHYHCVSIKKQLKRISLGVAVLVFLLLASAFTYERISRIVAERSFSPEGEMVDADGHRLHMLKQGNQGLAVVFESGLDPFGHLSWYKVEEEVSRFATTVSYDRAGHLWSERGSAPRTGGVIADELAAILDGASVPKPYILVGHSLGGMILRLFVAGHSDDVAGVVLVDSAHPEQVKRMPPIATEMPLPWLLSLANSFGIVRLMFPDKIRNTDPNDRINAVGLSLYHRSLGLIEEIRNLDRLTEEAGLITSFGDIPLVVISAANEERLEAFPEEYRKEIERSWSELQEELLALSTNSKQMLAYESGHYVQLDQPEIIIEAIRELHNAIMAMNLSSDGTVSLFGGND